VVKERLQVFTVRSAPNTKFVMEQDYVAGTHGNPTRQRDDLVAGVHIRVPLAGKRAAAIVQAVSFVDYADHRVD